MRDDTTTLSDRRRFLTRLGATLAAGVGLAAVPASRADASCTESTCGIYCYVEQCNGCNWGTEHLYRCLDRCWGWFYACKAGNCGGHCVSCPC